MRLRAWIAAFRWLHEKARKNALAPEEATAYAEAREDVAAMMVAAQRLTLNPGQTTREAMRVVRQLPLELQLASGAKVRGQTLDISTGGFSAVLTRAFQPGERVEFAVTLGSGLLTGHAIVASIHQQEASLRVSFKLDGVPRSDVDRLGTEVIDAALEQLALIAEAL